MSQQPGESLVKHNREKTTRTVKLTSLRCILENPSGKRTQSSYYSHHASRKHTQQEISTRQCPPPSRHTYLTQLCWEAGQSSSKHSKNNPVPSSPGRRKAAEGVLPEPQVNGSQCHLPVHFPVQMMADLSEQIPLRCRKQSRNLGATS